MMRYEIGNSFYKDNFIKKKIMIIVPHQDDELFMCGTILDSLCSVAKEIKVVFTTNGDRGHLFYRRYLESICALRVYGVKKRDIYFLGYGDQYETNYKHIYHAPKGETVRSSCGKKMTYGRDYCYLTQGIHHAYTIDNYEKDFEHVITDNMPDVIFCNDLDWHPDHRATSLIFDKVMGDILRNKTDYIPSIYKGFVYFLGWDGLMDYKSKNLSSTRKPSRQRSNDRRFELSNPYFKWHDRIRFPISYDMYKHKRNKLYKSISRYMFSQNARKYYYSMMNSDAVFWVRNTRNLALRAQISVSDGDAELLRDFVILDSNDITCISGMRYDEGIWRDYRSKNISFIKYSFENTIDAGMIVFYRDTFSFMKCDITGEVHVKYTDGTAVCLPLVIKKSEITHEMLLERVVGIEEIYIMFIKRPGMDFGFSEIEILSAKEKPRILKCMINNSFAYDYYIHRGELVKISVYSTLDEQEKIRLRVVGEGAHLSKDNALIIDRCFSECMIILQAEEDDKVFDIVRISRRD